MLSKGRPYHAPKTDRLTQTRIWELRNGGKSLTYRKLAKILWDIAYLCWANSNTDAPCSPFRLLLPKPPEQSHLTHDQRSKKRQQEHQPQGKHVRNKLADILASE